MPCSIPLLQFRQQRDPKCWCGAGGGLGLGPLYLLIDCWWGGMLWVYTWCSGLLLAVGRNSGLQLAKQCSVHCAASPAQPWFSDFSKQWLLLPGSSTWTHSMWSCVLSLDCMCPKPLTHARHECVTDFSSTNKSSPPYCQWLSLARTSSKDTACCSGNEMVRGVEKELAVVSKTPNSIFLNLIKTEELKRHHQGS